MLGIEKPQAGGTMKIKMSAPVITYPDHHHLLQISEWELRPRGLSEVTQPADSTAGILRPDLESRS